MLGGCERRVEREGARGRLAGAQVRKGRSAGEATEVGNCAAEICF